MANVNLLIGSLLFKHARNISECKHFLMLSINAAKSLDVSNEKVKNLYLRACSYLSGKLSNFVKTEATYLKIRTKLFEILTKIIMLWYNQAHQTLFRY